MIIKIPADTLFRVNRFIAKEPMRFSLNCIAITAGPTGVLAVATNGHAIGMEFLDRKPFQTPKTETILLRLHKKWRQYQDREDRWLIIDTTKRTCRLFNLEHNAEECIEILPKFEATTFPTWQSVIPALNHLKPYTSISSNLFDPKLLALFPCETGRKSWLKTSVQLWQPIRQRKFRNCIVVTVSVYDNPRVFFTGVLMGLREVPEGYHKPEETFMGEIQRAFEMLPKETK